MKWKWNSLSSAQLFATPWTVQSLEFSRSEYWSGWPFPSPGDLPNPGIKPWSPTLQADSLLSEPPGKPKNTGVGSLSLLQVIFPTRELNQGLLNCRQILYQLSHKGSPRILEWVAYLFSRGFSQPRNWTRVSCIVGRFFTNWAIREAPGCRGDTSKYKCWEYESFVKEQILLQVTSFLSLFLIKLKEEPIELLVGH